jgi:predicted aconitase with swiveling domain
MIRSRVLKAAAVEGPVLILDEPLSFWGAFEPRSGVILDVHHPQRGACLAGTILLMRESKGSGSAPGGIAEAIRLGNAPAGIILVMPDINLAVGAEVAETLYGRGCAVVAVSEDDFIFLCRAARLSISVTGEIRPETV